PRTAPDARRLFFFQAEDGIRGFHVTGVQTCALPISLNFSFSSSYCFWLRPEAWAAMFTLSVLASTERTALRTWTSMLCSIWRRRSEERRVGTEGRARGARHHCTASTRTSTAHGDSRA